MIKPYYQHNNTIIYCGHALDLLRSFPDESVSCIKTSPPYWGLRNYGIEPVIWDGDKNCEHNWGDKYFGDTREDQFKNWANKGSGIVAPHIKRFQGQFCTKCGAWKGSLGLEPTFKLYIQHLCDIFDEMHRVLRKDGTCWVNIGDTYWGGGQGGSDYPGKQIVPSSGYGHQAIGNTYSEKSQCCIPERFKIEMIDRGWICRNTLIWWKRNCLNGGTVLYAKTQKGVMPSTLKDLVRLKPETVQLWDGQKWQKVKEWIRNPNPQNTKEITFRNGETIKCTGEHFFPVINRGNVKAENLIIGDIIKSTTIPNETKEIEYLPDTIGWFLGIYLADGSLGDKERCLQFSSHIKEQDRFDFLKEIAIKYDAECYRFHKKGNAATFNIYSKILIAIVKTYIGGKSAKDKHLTNKVWQRNGYFLDALLSGYLSGDGYWDSPNNRYRLGFTRNDYLARDLRLLCARLGYFIKLQKSNSICNGKTFKTYKGEIRKTKSVHRNNKSDYQIVKIIKGKNAGKFWDVILENEPHLFASHSGLLVHNCMPSSATDRFTVDFEYIYFFVKSNNTVYWTHIRNLKLVSEKPDPDYRWVNYTGYELKQPPDDPYWKKKRVKCPDCNGTGKVDFFEETKLFGTIKVASGARCEQCYNPEKPRDHTVLEWKRINLWQGHDYWFEQQFEEYTEPLNRWGGHTLKNSSNKYIEMGGYDGNQKFGSTSILRKGGILRPFEQGKNMRCVWDIPTKNFSESHFAVFPDDLVVTPIKAGCPEFICKKCGLPRVRIFEEIKGDWIPTLGTSPDAKKGGKRTRFTLERNDKGYTDCGCNAGFEPGIILDPFVGTGTVLKIARRLNRKSIGIDIKEDYLKMSVRGLAQEEIF